MKNIQLVPAIALGALMVASGCAGDDGGEGPAPLGLRVSGSVGAGYRVASATRIGGLSRVASWLGLGSPAFADGTEPTVDRVVALKVERGSLTAASLVQGHEATVDADGTFVLDLEKRFDWLLVLVNSKATGPDRFIGSVQIDAGTGGSEGLLEVPVSVAQIDRVDLGALSRKPTGKDTGDAVASEVVVPQDFGMTVQQLRALSRTDDVFRNARNILVNHDAATGTWYTVMPGFAWSNPSAVTPGFTSPTASRFEGYAFQMDTNSPSVTVEALCGEGDSRVVAGLFPPVDVAMNEPPSTVYGPSHGMTNDQVTACTTEGAFTRAVDRDFFAQRNGAGSDQYLSYGFSGARFPYPIAQGDWVWKENGQARAVFDLSVAAPMAAGGLQAGYVPSIRLAPEGDGRVPSVDVRWSYWDESTESYVDVGPAELDVLRHSLGAVEVALYEKGHDTDTTEKIVFDPAIEAAIGPKDPWYYGVEPPVGGKRLEKVMLFCEVGGIGRVVSFTGFP
jgi:hypothetical protein